MKLKYRVIRYLANSKFNDLFFKIEKLYGKLLLKNRNFSCISNNCWYLFKTLEFEIPYRSPTVNLWIKPIYFLRLLKDLDYYLNQELEISTPYQDFDGQWIITGKLEGDKEPVEIEFVHFDSFLEAKDKWGKGLRELIRTI